MTVIVSPSPTTLPEDTVGSSDLRWGIVGPNLYLAPVPDEAKELRAIYLYFPEAIDSTVSLASQTSEIQDESIYGPIYKICEILARSAGLNDKQKEYQAKYFQEVARSRAWTNKQNWVKGTRLKAPAL